MGGPIGRIHRLCHTSVLMVFCGIVVAVLTREPMTSAEQSDRQMARWCEGDGELSKDQFGFVSDDVDDVGAEAPSYLDLYMARLGTVEGKEDVELLLATRAFPKAGSVDATYRFLFDADDQDGTGVTIDGSSGIEREIRIVVSGRQGFDSLSVAGSVIDHVSKNETPLPTSPELKHEPLLDSGSDAPVEAQFLATIPRNLLGLTANQISVTVVAQGNRQDTVDTTSFIFDQKAWERYATLTLSSAAPGGLVQFSIKGLTPATYSMLTLMNPWCWQIR